MDKLAEKIINFTKEGSVKIVDSKVKRSRRKTISDSLIDDELLKKIVQKLYTKVSDIYNPSQLELIDIMLPMGLSNKTMARIVNEMCIECKATENSVRALIKYKRNKDDMLNNLLKDLGIEEEG